MDRAESALIESSSHGSPLRILYVEDNPIVREVTVELLDHSRRQITALNSIFLALLHKISSLQLDQ